MSGFHATYDDGSLASVFLPVVDFDEEGFARVLDHDRGQLCRAVDYGRRESARREGRQFEFRGVHGEARHAVPAQPGWYARKRCYSDLSGDEWVDRLPVVAWLTPTTPNDFGFVGAALVIEDDDEEPLRVLESDASSVSFFHAEYAPEAARDA